MEAWAVPITPKKRNTKGQRNCYNPSDFIVPSEISEEIIPQGMQYPRQKSFSKAKREEAIFQNTCNFPHILQYIKHISCHGHQIQFN